MAFCGKCGAQYGEGTKFCPSCGAPIEQPEAKQTQQTPQQPKAQTNAGQSDFSAKLQKLNDTADTTEEFDKNDIEKNKTMAILAYLSWLVLIPLFTAKESKFARYHVNQGIVLAIVETIWWIIEAVLSGICGAISYWFGSFVSTVLGIANLVFLVMLVIGILNAANGKAKELPIIGKLKIIK